MSDEQTATPAPEVVSIPASAPSAPAERPGSWDEAFAQVDAAAAAAPATTEDTSPTVPTPAPATAAPVDPSAPVTGEPPRDRWPDILANARAKERAAAIQEHQRYIDWGKALEANPVSALDLVRSVMSDPEHGPLIASELGRMLRSVRKGPAVEDAPTAPTAKPDPEPDADLQTADGQLVYSAPQLKKWQEWHARQLESKFSTQLQPLQQLHQGLQQRAALGKLWKDTNARVKTVVDRYAALPAFQSHKAAITARVKELFDSGVTDPAEALGVAYAQILHQTVLPAAGATAQAPLVAKATAHAAGKSDNPAQAAPIVGKRPRSWDEAFESVGLV